MAITNSDIVDDDNPMPPRRRKIQVGRHPTVQPPPPEQRARIHQRDKNVRLAAPGANSARFVAILRGGLAPDFGSSTRWRIRS
jgi:hypothetical protein